jgi:serine/threonine protein kinase
MRADVGRNVFLSKDMVAKVADFGMCVNEPRSCQPLGTPHWMAPEVGANYLDQESYYDKRCDVYSYAILVWEIFHAKIPYQDSGMTDPMQIVRAVVTHGKRPQLGRACPAPIATIISKCWDRDPAARPTFAEVPSPSPRAPLALLSPPCGPRLLVRRHRLAVMPGGAMVRCAGVCLTPPRLVLCRR